MVQKLIDARVVVGFPVLRAMAGIIRQGDCSTGQALVLQSFAVNWFETEIAAGGHMCPCCGNLWTTAEKRAACTHAGGSPSPETAETISRWIDMAEAQI